MTDHIGDATTMIDLDALEKPRRVQLSRAKGWRMLENTVSVARPGRWGNPFRIGDFGIPTALDAVQRFRGWCGGYVVGPTLPDIMPLRGKNLACWCRLDQPCHADVLLELANDPAFLARNGKGEG